MERVTADAGAEILKCTLVESMVGQKIAAQL